MFPPVLSYTLLMTISMRLQILFKLRYEIAEMQPDVTH